MVWNREIKSCTATFDGKNPSIEKIINGKKFLKVLNDFHKTYMILNIYCNKNFDYAVLII